MSGPRKRKVDRECRVFHKEWTTQYFFTDHRSTAVCPICQETVAVFKELNISCYFATKHANYASEQSTKEREGTAQIVCPIHEECEPGTRGMATDRGYKCLLMYGRCFAVFVQVAFLSTSVGFRYYDLGCCLTES